MSFMRFDDGCGRMVLRVKAKDLQKHYNLANTPPEIEPSFDVSPGQTVPIVIDPELGEHKLEMAKWGLIPFWSKDPKVGYKLFNARDDNIFNSPVWRGVILRKRALVPATGFYEWTKPEKGSKEPKKKFYFKPKQQDLFSIAGVWETWKDVEDKKWMTFSLITTEANKEMRPIHNRMPVILHPEDEPKWLESSRTKREDIEPFLRPLEDNSLEVVEVSSDAKAYEYNDERRIAPLNSR